MKLVGMNIELTTACPLRCPQCYCSLEGGKHIPLETAKKYLHQAKALGLQHVELSGGETLCYPHLYELISEAHTLEIETNIAISGWGFTETVLNQLMEAGLDNIYVSLNGPTEEINRLSRDGYTYSIAALELLKKKNFRNVYINWVMHRNVADYLPDMLTLAKKYDVKTVVVMAPKPTSKHELNTLPTLEQMEQVVKILRSSPEGTLGIESCFSPMLAIACDTKLFGNLNVGPYKGCCAGRSMLSVSVDGLLSPCRHLEHYEKWDSLQDYWEKSPVLNIIRSLEAGKREPCLSCRFSDYCRPCLAVNSKLNGDLYIGHASCPVALSSN